MKIKCGIPSYYRLASIREKETASVKDKQKPELSYMTNESILQYNYKGNKYDSYLKLKNRFTI